jgi:HEAT repeat.
MRHTVNPEGQLIIARPLVLTLLAGILISITCSRPTYEGKTYDAWRSELKDLSPKVRAQAVDALGHFGKTSVGELIDVFKDPDPDVRSVAVTALVRVGEPAIPDLVYALDSSLYAKRQGSIPAL